MYKNLTTVPQASSAIYFSSTNILPEFNALGSFTPKTLSEKLKTPSGRKDNPTIDVLSEIIYWYRPSKSGQSKFNGIDLQISYAQLQENCGYSRRAIAYSLVKLEKLGLVKRNFRTIRTQKTLCSNVLFISINKPALLEFMNLNTPLQASVQATSQTPPYCKICKTYTKNKIISIDISKPHIEEIVDKYDLSSPEIPDSSTGNNLSPVDPPPNKPIYTTKKPKIDPFQYLTESKCKELNLKARRYFSSAATRGMMRRIISQRAIDKQPPLSFIRPEHLEKYVITALASEKLREKDDWLLSKYNLEEHCMARERGERFVELSDSQIREKFKAQWSKDYSKEDTKPDSCPDEFPITNFIGIGDILAKMMIKR